MSEKENGRIEVDLEHELELTDEDILDAMQHVPGYLDISTEDFRTIYHLAWRHAVARLLARKRGEGQ
jgi:CBS domain-containing membrane protein